MKENKQYVTDRVDCDWWDIKMEFFGGTVVTAASDRDFHQAWKDAGEPKCILRTSSGGVPARGHPVIWAETHEDSAVMSAYFGVPILKDQGFTFATGEALRLAASGLKREGMILTKDKLGWCFRPKNDHGVGRIVPETPHKVLVTPKAPDEAPPWG